jgi:hypothetical protein
MDFRYTCGAKNKWYSKIDNKRFEVLLDPDMYMDLICDEFELEEELEAFLQKVIKKDGYIHLPFEFEVCSSCNGRGKYVDPNIDSQGITMEDWDNWSEEDKDNYRNGFYDVTCGECNGEKVVPALSDNYYGELKIIASIVKNKINDDYQYARESYIEWKMGY